MKIVRPWRRPSLSSMMLPQRSRSTMNWTASSHHRSVESKRPLITRARGIALRSAPRYYTMEQTQVSCTDAAATGAYGVTTALVLSRRMHESQLLLDCTLTIVLHTSGTDSGLADTIRSLRLWY